jgi:hypothetical protein
MGATVTVINSTTAAVTTKQRVDARAYDRITIEAVGLAGAEEVDILKGGGKDWVPFTMPDGTTPAKLTATNASIELPGGYYGIIKDATVAAVEVNVSLIGNG